MEILETRSNTAMQPGEMTPVQIHDEIDRLTDLAQKRYQQSLPFRFISNRISVLIDELEHRGEMPVER